MNSDLSFQSLAETAAQLESDKISSVELTTAMVKRATALDPKINAFNSFDPEDALTQANASDEHRRQFGARSPLEGIPIGLKDVIAVRDQPLTASSRMLANFISPYDATVAVKLREAGAVLWGRLNMDEFAMGSSTENSATKITSNPWDLSRVPGGSSGGSAAAVAAGMAYGTLGSDTGGSIRQPAAFCGVVGLKPTYGRVSRYGLIAFASSLDQIGTFGRTTEDAAILLGAIAGHDPRDSTSYDAPVPNFREAFSQPDRSWKIGLPKEYFGAGLDPEVAAAVDAATNFYRSHGCTIHEVSLPHTEYCLDTYYIIATAEASSNLARYDGVRYGHRTSQPADLTDMYARSRAEGFGAEVKRRIILGTYVLSSGYYDAFYLRAQKVRTLIRQDFLRAFEEVDVLLTPTAPTPAFKIGEKADPLAMYLCDIYTIGVNLAGLPGISVPCGFSRGGLPIGLQLIGQPFRETDLVQIAHSFERAHEFQRRHPTLA